MVGAGADPRAAGGAGPRGRRRRGRGLIRIVAVGKPRGALAAAAADYEGRLARVLKLEIVEVREEPLQGRSSGEVLERERKRLEPHLRDAVVACLDRRGRQFDSEALAAWVGERETTPPQRTAFVIGGSCGLADGLLDRAGLVLSFGALTLPHQLARVVLAEQLYRATTILRGEPYHR